jgi:predicted PurR-regulated permease PerM
MNPNSTRVEQILSVVVLGVLVVGCVTVLLPFLPAIMWAVILAISMQPAYAWLARRFRGRRSAAALVLTLLLAMLLLVPVVTVGTSLASNWDELVAAVGPIVQGGLPEPPGWLQSLPFVGEAIDGYLRSLAHDSRKLSEEVGRLLRPLGAKLPAIGAALGEGLLQLSLSVLIAFFVFRDGKPIRQKVESVADRLAGERGRRLVEVGHSTIVGVVYGIIGTAIAQGVLAGIGFAIAGVPAAALLGLLTFFLSVVPVGPPMVWAPAAVWLWFQGHTGWAIFLVLWGSLVVSSVDNFLKPLLISRGSQLPFILVMLGVFGGIVAFGFVGVFLGPTLLALGYRLLVDWVPGRVGGPGAADAPASPIARR